MNGFYKKLFFEEGLNVFLNSLNYKNTFLEFDKIRKFTITCVCDKMERSWWGV